MGDLSELFRKRGASTLEQQFNVALHYLRRNYPNTVTTWGTCCSDCCDKPARGSSYCANCAEEVIAEIIDDKEIAAGIHAATKEASDFIDKALNKISL